MTVDAYFADLRRRIAETLTVTESLLILRLSDANSGTVKGVLLLSAGFQLHVAEFIVTGPTLDRRSYRYHLQDAERRLVRRWDNAPHYPDLPTFPHHCHLPDGTVIPSPPMDLPAVLQAVGPLLA